MDQERKELAVGITPEEVLQSAARQKWQEALGDPILVEAAEAGLRDLRVGKSQPWDEIRARNNSVMTEEGEPRLRPGMTEAEIDMFEGIGYPMED